MLCLNVLNTTATCDMLLLCWERNTLIIMTRGFMLHVDVEDDHTTHLLRPRQRRQTTQEEVAEEYM